jgi:predicted transcriptional regulator
MATKAKAMTVRLPFSLYRAGRELARKRKTSLNRLLQESLSAALQEESRAKLYEAFTLVGEDVNESDVAYGLAAQAEVVARDDS